MKTKFIKEPIMDSYMWFVYDCTNEDLNDWVKKKFGYEIEEHNAWHKGKCVFIENEEKGTMDWVVWASNDISLAHEIIHYVFEIFRFHKLEHCWENEELFCRLHTYYFNECLKLVHPPKKTSSHRKLQKKNK